MTDDQFNQIMQELQSQSDYLESIDKSLSDIDISYYLNYKDFYDFRASHGYMNDSTLVNSYLSVRDPVPQGFDIGVLLMLFFSAFLGGFLLITLSRLCSFAISAVKKLLDRI